jgi:hypothetical protein
MAWLPEETIISDFDNFVIIPKVSTKNLDLNDVSILKLFLDLYTQPGSKKNDYSYWKKYHNGNKPSIRKGLIDIVDITHAIMNYVNWECAYPDLKLLNQARHQRKIYGKKALLNHIKKQLINKAYNEIL